MTVTFLCLDSILSIAKINVCAAVSSTTSILVSTSNFVPEKVVPLDPLAWIKSPTLISNECSQGVDKSTR